MTVEGGEAWVSGEVPVRNYLKEMRPSLLMSKTAMTRWTRGFWLSYGTLNIYLGSRSPEESESI